MEDQNCAVDMSRNGLSRQWQVSDPKVTD